jgi:hypothetical protein
VIKDVHSMKTSLEEIFVKLVKPAVGVTS